MQWHQSTIGTGTEVDVVGVVVVTPTALMIDPAQGLVEVAVAVVVAVTKRNN